MTNKSHIYILIHGEEKMFKIGKTNSLKNRIYSLKNTWGEFNLEKSYSISCYEKDVYNLENMIHLVLEDFRIKLDPLYGNGYTEFFKIEGLENAINLCNTFSNKNICIKKGIIIKSKKKTSISKQGLLLNKLKVIKRNKVNFIKEKTKVIFNEDYNNILDKNYIYMTDLDIYNKNILKLVLFLILVEKTYKGFNNYMYKISGLMNLLGLANSKYDIFYNILDSIGFKVYSQKKGFLILKLESTIIENSNKIQGISLGIIAKFKKIYSIYLYIFFFNNIKYKKINIGYEELKTFLHINGKYYRYFDFKKKVLLYANMEFSKYLQFSFVEEKVGRKVKNILFEIEEDEINNEVDHMINKELFRNWFSNLPLLKQQELLEKYKTGVSIKDKEMLIKARISTDFQKGLIG